MLRASVSQALASAECFFKHLKVSRQNTMSAFINRILLPGSRCLSQLHRPTVHSPSFFVKMLAMAATEPLEPIPKLAKLEVPVSNGATHHTPKLLVKKLSPNAITPSRSSTLAAGYDISSAYDDVVPANGKALIKTDISIAIPERTYARLAPRSGLAWKHSIDVGAGVIDADYCGPVGVVLFNLSDQDFTIKAGDRVAQLILERIVTPEVMEVDDLEVTVRGEGGFGSTGIATVLPSS